jgi:Protein of unknown function (DUF2793)
MVETVRLKLPLLAAGQSQKHVTMNDGLTMLDALAQLTVTNRTRTTPPISSLEGDCYLVAANPTGSWIGHTDEIARFDSGGWIFHQPSEGWRCYVIAEQALLVRLAGQWVAAASPVAPALFGINTSADSTNRLALKSNASLFDHVGAGHQLKINKATAVQTATVLFQNTYSGRAEMGLMGDDKFRIKGSANGTAWKDVLIADPATGLATVFGAPVDPNGIATKAYVDVQTGTASVAFDYQTTVNQTLTTGTVWTTLLNFNNSRIPSPNFDPALNRFTAPVAGVYLFTAQVVITAGASAVTVTAAVGKNGTPSGNWVSRYIAAGAQENLSLVTLLQMATGDTAPLLVYGGNGSTVNFGFTSFAGVRM